MNAFGGRSGPRGPQGAQGAQGAQGEQGEQGAQGSGLATSLSSLWVNEPGVLGVATPFVLADWQDATTGPNTCGATALDIEIHEGRVRATLPLGVARFAAFSVALPGLIDGADVCMRFAVDFQLAVGGIGSTYSGSVLAGLFEGPGADVKYVAAGFTRASAPGATGTWGRWASSSNISAAANLGGDSAAGFGAAHLTCLDVRARRVGSGTRLFMAVHGGPWFTADGGVAASTVNLGLGTARAGIRLATTTSTITSACATMIAFGQFNSGLPARIAQG